MAAVRGDMHFSWQFYELVFNSDIKEFEVVLVRARLATWGRLRPRHKPLSQPLRLRGAFLVAPQ